MFCGVSSIYVIGLLLSKTILFDKVGLEHNDLIIFISIICITVEFHSFLYKGAMQIESPSI